MIMPPSEIRAVPDFPLYWVEWTGQVWSQRTLKNGATLWTKLKYCHSITKVSGYPQIMLCCGMWHHPKTGKLRVRKKLVTLHSVVAAAWIGPKPPGYGVIHTQGDRQNPSLYAPDGSIRLRYGTHAECLVLMRERGRFQIGINHRLASLTEEVVREARRAVLAGEHLPAVARRLGASSGAIRKAVTGYTWKHVTDPPPLPTSRGPYTATRSR